MYAVVSSGGKQYRVEPGATLLVERIGGDRGASVTFDRVLMVADGDDVMVGTPTVAGATVIGTILGEELGPKIVVFKFKQKVKYRRRTGHRQHLVRVRIDEISADGKTSRAEPAAVKAEPETAAPSAEPAEAPAEPTGAPQKRKRSRASKPEPAKAADASVPQEAEAATNESKATSTRSKAPRRRTAKADTADKE